MLSKSVGKWYISLICVHKQGLALNNQLWLICHKSKSKPNSSYYETDSMVNFFCETDFWLAWDYHASQNLFQGLCSLIYINLFSLLDTSDHKTTSSGQKLHLVPIGKASILPLGNLLIIVPFFSLTVISSLRIRSFWITYSSNCRFHLLEFFVCDT